jgi:hypothetical protein
MRREAGVRAAKDELHAAFKDNSPYVRIAAARALAQYGNDTTVEASLRVLVELSDWSKQDVFTAMAALTALDTLGKKTWPVAKDIQALPNTGPLPDGRYSAFVPDLLNHLQKELGLQTVAKQRADGKKKAKEEL